MGRYFEAVASRLRPALTLFEVAPFDSEAEL
jgi:hypothetical protein